MWDDRFTGQDGAESTPAELEPIHHRLEEVGAAWRAELPSSAGFIARMDALLAATAADQSPRTAIEAVARPLPSPAPRTADARRSLPRGATRWSRMGSLAVIAAIAIVVLFAAYFQFAPTGPGGRRTTPPGAWGAATSFGLSDGETPYIAQSDPRVIYRLDAHAIKLQRSDDAGATWHTVPQPATEGGSLSPVFAGLQLSPLDARTVFLTLFGDPVKPPCASSAPEGSPQGAVGGARLAAPLMVQVGGPNYSCIQQYVSADGGAHWVRLTLPDDGRFAEPVFRKDGGPHMPLVAQGDRIYAAMLPKSPASGASFFAVRLITSADDGLTWRTADDALAQHGEAIEDYVATPSGLTLWAATTDHGLWRSEDAGATWARVGDIPQANLAAASGGATPVIYLQTPSAALGDIAADGVQASTNGGAQWQRAPSVGIPDGQRADPRSAQVRADGALVMLFRRTELRIEFSDGMLHDAAYYAWKPGAPTWTPLTRQFDAQEIMQQWFAAAVGRPGGTLWALVYRDDALTYNGEAYIKDGTYTLMRAVLAPGAAGAA